MNPAVAAISAFEVADVRLRARVPKGLSPEFFKALVPIVSGVKAIAEADPKANHVSLIDDCSKLAYPPPCGPRDLAKLIVANNIELHLSDRSPSVIEQIWSRYKREGVLGLRSVVVCILDNFLQAVDLVFPLRRNAGLLSTDGYETVLDGYSIIRIERNGEISYWENRLFARLGWGFNMSLGIIRPGDMLQWSRLSGPSIEEGLDIPGLTDYLAKHISSLGPYLMGLAEQIAANRKK